MLLVNMIRTQVYISEREAYRIKTTARRHRKSQAEVIREALAQGLNTLQPNPSGGGAGLLAVAQLGQRLGVQGPRDLSARIDQELYGE
jgi:hypothetical protein